MADWLEIGDKEEGIDLDLSLSLGRSFSRSEKPSSTADESGFPMRKIMRCDSPMSDAENNSSVTDGIKDCKREQRENRRKRGVAGVECLDSGADERRSKKEKKRKHENIVDVNLSNQSFLPCNLFSTAPMEFLYPPVQFLPRRHMNGYSFPCVMPCWGPGSGAGSFKPNQVNQIINQSGKFKFDNGATEKSFDSSLNCSSSVVADDNFSGLCSRSRSSQSLRDLESNGSTGNDDSINHMDHAATSRRPDDHNPAEGFDGHAIRGNQKVIKSSNKAKNNKFLKAETRTGDSPSLSSMPCVSAAGDGPDGKRITGFLYRYTQSEVRIVCICHGKSLSPAEFVKHAGGKEGSNPLRQITVTPFAFA